MDYFELIYNAALHGDSDENTLLNHLKEYPIDIKKANELGAMVTPAESFAKQGNFTACKLLIKYGASAHAVAHIAAQVGNPYAEELLTEDSSLLVDIARGAAEGGHIDFVKSLIRKDPSLLIEITGAAIKGGHVDLAKVLLKENLPLLSELALGSHREAAIALLRNSAILTDIARSAAQAGLREFAEFLRTNLDAPVNEICLGAVLGKHRKYRNQLLINPGASLKVIVYKLALGGNLISAKKLAGKPLLSDVARGAAQGGHIKCAKELLIETPELSGDIAFGAVQGGYIGFVNMLLLLRTLDSPQDIPFKRVRSLPQFDQKFMEEFLRTHNKSTLSAVPGRALDGAILSGNQNYADEIIDKYKEELRSSAVSIASYAAQSGNQDYIKLLLKNKSKEETLSLIRYIAHGSAKGGHIDYVRKLLAQHPSLLDDIARGAAEGGYIKFAEELRNLGASISVIAQGAKEGGYFVYVDALGIYQSLNGGHTTLSPRAVLRYTNILQMRNNGIPFPNDTLLTHDTFPYNVLPLFIAIFSSPEADRPLTRKNQGIGSNISGISQLIWMKILPFLGFRNIGEELVLAARVLNSIRLQGTENGSNLLSSMHSGAAASSSSTQDTLRNQGTTYQDEVTAGSAALSAPPQQGSEYEINNDPQKIAEKEDHKVTNLQLNSINQAESEQGVSAYTTANRFKFEGLTDDGGTISHQGLFNNQPGTDSHTANNDDDDQTQRNFTDHNNL